MKNARILVFAEYGWRNGGENSWLAVARRLKQESFEFVVACPQQTELSDCLSGFGIGTLPWDVKDDAGKRKSQQGIRSEMSDLVLNVKPDIVHCNSLSTGRLYGPLTIENGIPSVGYLRDIIKLSKKAIDDINGLTSIVAVSNATRDFHIAQGVSAEKSKVIYNGVDLDEFQPAPVSKYLHIELGIGKDVRLITCIGQIGMRKGTDVVIRAFLELLKQFDDLALVLVGIRNSIKDEAVEFEKSCLQLCESPQAVGKIFWLGRRNDVANILNESTLLLHGARQEPLGRVLLESLAVGCPFVATSVGGTTEIVTGLDSQYLVCDKDSPSMMAVQAFRFLKNKSLRQNTFTRFREHAGLKFDIGNCAEELGHSYLDLLTTSRS